MKTVKILITMVFICSSVASSWAQVMGNLKYREQELYNTYNINQVSEARIADNSQILIEINGLLNAEADEYVAMFNVNQVGESLVEVNKLMNYRISSLIKDITNLGLDTNQIYIDMISQVPVYNYEVEKKLFSKTYNEVPAGFELQKNIHIKYNNPQILDKIIYYAAKYEIYDLVKVDYYIKDYEKQSTLLREKVIAELSKKLKEYEKIGFKLDTLYKVLGESAYVKYPVTQYKKYEAFSRPSLDAAKKTKLIGEVKVENLYKTSTYFYNKIPYDQYEVVINPVVFEPAIQFVYNLSVKFIIKEETPKTNKQFILVTPEGNFKTLDIR